MRAAILLAGLLLACSGQARADDLFTNFQTICIANTADEAAAIGKADAAGWMPIPQAMLQSISLKDLQGVQGRMRSSTAQFLLMMTGHGSSAQSMNLHARFCAVASMVGTEGGLDKQAADYAAVPNDTTLCEDKLCYAWREDNGTHTQVTRDDPEFKTLAQSGSLRILMTKRSDKMSMLLFIVPSQ